jgi:hypothetical protein
VHRSNINLQHPGANRGYQPLNPLFTLVLSELKHSAAGGLVRRIVLQVAEDSFPVNLAKGRLSAHVTRILQTLKESNRDTSL